MRRETIQAINRFRDERHWRQFHNPKDLAISISLEASELLELFQWKHSEDVVGVKSGQLQDELADVLIYAAMLADDLGFDLDEIVMKKLEKNVRKYPVEKCMGRSTKYTDLLGPARPAMHYSLHTGPALGLLIMQCQGLDLLTKSHQTPTLWYN